MYRASKAWHYIELVNSRNTVVRIHYFRRAAGEYEVGYEFDKNKPLCYDHIKFFQRDFFSKMKYAKLYMEVLIDRLKNDEGYQEVRFTVK